MKQRVALIGLGAAAAITLGLGYAPVAGSPHDGPSRLPQDLALSEWGTSNVAARGAYVPVVLYDPLVQQVLPSSAGEDYSEGLRLDHRPSGVPLQSPTLVVNTPRPSRDSSRMDAGDESGSLFGGSDAAAGLSGAASGWGWLADDVSAASAERQKTDDSRRKERSDSFSRESLLMDASGPSGLGGGGAAGSDLGSWVLGSSPSR